MKYRLPRNEILADIAKHIDDRIAAMMSQALELCDEPSDAAALAILAPACILNTAGGVLAQAVPELAALSPADRAMAVAFVVYHALMRGKLAIGMTDVADVKRMQVACDGIIDLMG